jgi:hypothetical protein
MAREPVCAEKQLGFPYLWSVHAIEYSIIQQSVARDSKQESIILVHSYNEHNTPHNRQTYTAMCPHSAIVNLLSTHPNVSNTFALDLQYCRPGC